MSPGRICLHVQTMGAVLANRNDRVRQPIKNLKPSSQLEVWILSTNEKPQTLDQWEALNLTALLSVRKQMQIH